MSCPPSLVPPIYIRPRGSMQLQPTIYMQSILPTSTYILIFSIPNFEGTLCLVSLIYKHFQVMFSTDGYAFPETYYLGTFVIHRLN